MKRLNLILLFLLASTMIASSQTQVVHFKRLQEFLPSITMQGFERKKPTGQTQTAMGMTSSEAKVRFLKPGTEETGEVSIEVTISDITGVPFAALAFAFQAGEFENETEEGYEKSITLKKKYRGKETVSSGEYKHCQLEFMLVNRFTIKLQGNGTDEVTLLRKLAESMDLEKLEKVTPEQ